MKMHTEQDHIADNLDEIRSRLAFLQECLLPQSKDLSFSEDGKNGLFFFLEDIKEVTKCANSHLCKIC